MKTLYVNREVVKGPWGGGNAFRIALETHSEKLGWKVTSDLRCKPDAILVMGLGPEGGCPGYEPLVHHAHRTCVPVVIRCNENDARKNTQGVDAAWARAFAVCDKVVFVSDWLAEYHQKVGSFPEDRDYHVVKNGVDKEIFKPNKKFDNGKINIVMSHWSDNPMKGHDYAEWIDDFVGIHPTEFTFTYIGRTKVRFEYSSHIQPLFGKALGEQLGMYDVCINASRYDPGPNSVIEPIACGLPTYVHVDGGGGVEFAGNDHTFSSFGDLECLLTTKQFVPNKTVFQSWDACIQKSLELIENVCGKYTG